MVFNMNRERLLPIILGLVLTANAQAAQRPGNDARDFSGTWRDWQSTIGDTQTNQMFVIGVDLPYKPATQDLTAERLEMFKAGRDRASPHLTCRPTGVQGFTAQKGAMLVIESPQEVALLFEDDREVRHVYLNQPHPTDLKQSYTGDSVGHWDGNTLVIDTLGYNGKGLLDEIGTPHGTQLHLVERLTKSEDGRTLTDEITFTDPEYYTRPFTKTRTWHLVPGERLRDYDCAENPRQDDFDKLTYDNDWFKPTCVRPVKDGKAAEKVVCSHPSR
ncbi:MAG: hypothetical protein JWL65_230 [Gammaproteobacteria bacterium]|nr:hypothetical protein [Gammaproteobacteria bacterium]